jgi:hypothetical protein
VVFFGCLPVVLHTAKPIVILWGFLCPLFYRIKYLSVRFLFVSLVLFCTFVIGIACLALYSGRLKCMLHV